MNRFHFVLPVLAMSLALNAGPAAAQTPVGSAITYQGQLEQSGSPVNGSVNLIFTLFDAVVAGNQVGAAQAINGVAVSEGLFTVTLNAAAEFGAGAFNGSARWLEIRVNGVTLSPRQPLTAAPYAEFALRPWEINGANISYTAGNVGIGTANPSNRLTVSNPTDNSAILAIDSGATAAQSSSLRLNDRGTPFWAVNKNASNDFAIREIGPSADRFYIAQGGNVGIGTSSPSNRLTVFNSAGGDTVLAVDSGTSAAQNSVLRLHDRGTAIWSLNKLVNNDLAIREVATSADRLYVAQGGNIGIGTSNPGVKLQIQGGSDASLGGGGFLVCGSTTGTNLVLDNNELMVRNNGAAAPLFINNAGGDVTIAPGNTTHVGVLEIMGGADLSEPFDIGGNDSQPGMLVVIDPDHAGQLKPSTKAYDRRVAGVISGAGGVQPGVMMSQRGTLADGMHAVALTGRVYCLADAANGAIEPGDFLTTSDIPGHAMKATDDGLANGAVIGKAMTSLNAGQRGLVLVLVNLQ
jgi:hypothetical protein